MRRPFVLGFAALLVVCAVGAGVAFGLDLTSSTSGSLTSASQGPLLGGALGGVPAPTKAVTSSPGSTALIASPSAIVLGSVACEPMWCVAVGEGAGDAGAATWTSTPNGSWSPALLPSATASLDAVACTPKGSCVAGGQGVLLRSADSGKTWTAVSLPAHGTEVLGVTCRAPECLATGIADPSPGAFSNSAAMMRSTDTGATWSQVPVPHTVAGLGAVTCATETLCVAVGSTILVSTNGGRTWNHRAVAGGIVGLRAVACPSARTCVAVGQNLAGISDPNAPGESALSVDGGETWSSQALPAGTAAADAITCVAPTACMLGASAAEPSTNRSALLARSSSRSAGVTWQGTNTVTGLGTLDAIACESSALCVAVGRSAATAAVAVGPPASTTWQERTAFENGSD